MYISLDIETTGLNNEKDDIIELAAIKFDENKVHEKYQTLVKVHYDLPPLITHITGITNEDLLNAPDLDEVMEDFMDFVGDDPIIGHNISFDMDFLRAKGMIFENTLYDTLPLAAIMQPGLPSYSLDIITTKLGIKHVAKHRALDDCIATADLFNKLTEKISEIDSSTLEEIKSLVSRSNWPLKDIFLLAKSNVKKQKKENGNGDEEERNTLNFDKQEILDFYKSDGPLSQIEKDYEVRDPQIKMTEKIVDAFEEGHNLLCEAGTGTGKSIAYVLPSIFKARSANKKVVIASHTKNLQDQLYLKDIPKLEKVFGENTFKATVLKGRRNYLSVERLNKFKDKSFFQPHEITMLIKVLLWLPKTKTGDKEEVSLQQKEFYSWNDISCDAFKCPHHDPVYNNRCFLAKARDKAQKADIIITNHALLLSDTVGPSPVLPEHEYLVIDEAHHLENEATKSLTINITSDIFEQIIKNFRSLLKKNPELIEKLENLESKFQIFFGIMGICYEKNIHYFNSIFNLMLNDYVTGTPEWHKAKESAENVILYGEQIYKIIHEFTEEIEDEDFDKALTVELENLATFLRHFAFVILEEGLTDFGKNITWIYKGFDERLGIKSAPLQVSEHLKGTLFHEKKSVILTSATLTVDHSFNYIRHQLGLDESFEEIILPSHFSYPDQVEVVLYENIKAPATEGYFDQTCDIILNQALENKGRMLVLFTSKKAIEATYLKLAPILKEKDITILAQNFSGGRNKIIELFKQDPERSILFGTNSFWEGIDIKGESLSCVIIQKLPFDPPDDPIHSSRSRLTDDPFFDYQIPRAILKFKQGFGRLIRSTKDSGKVIVLDSRLISKSYGQIFLNSLPEGVKIEKKRI